MRPEEISFVVVVSRNVPKTVSRNQMESLVMRLQKLARALDRNAVNLCNVPNHKDQRERLAGKVYELLSEYRLTWAINVCGDPRGYALKIHFPSGDYNTMGGVEEGYGVPC